MVKLYSYGPMTAIANPDDLALWLKRKPSEWACAITARIALRIVPILGRIICAGEESGRAQIALPALVALRALSSLSASPDQFAPVRPAIRAASRSAADAMTKAFNESQMDMIDAIKAAPEERLHIFDDSLDDSSAISVAVDAISHAVNVASETIDVIEKIASSDIIIESVVSAAMKAHLAVDGVNGYQKEALATLEANFDIMEKPRHTSEFWTAVDHDTVVLDRNCEKYDKTALVENLLTSALWPEIIPVWVSQRWTDVKDELSDEEGWHVWVDWYEDRLAGRNLNTTLEVSIVKTLSEEWKKGPSHVNTMIEKTIQLQSDPMFFAIEHADGELDAVKQVSYIDLTRHRDRIQDALSKDPYQAVGATKDMLEAVMKTILNRRGILQIDQINFPKLATRCLTELGLKGDTEPSTESEKHLRRMAHAALKMILTANELRNEAGTGHGRVIGREPVVTAADARLVASIGLILAAWLLHHDASNQSHSIIT